MKLRIDNDTFRYLNAFATLTGVAALDCFEENGEVVYVVEPGKIGIAVGRKGSNIRKVEELLKKKITLVEYSPDPIIFVRNILFPIRPRQVYIATKSDGRKVVTIVLDRKARRALTANGKKLYNLLLKLMSRHHPSYGVEVREA